MTRVWDSMLTLDISVWEKILRTVLLYLLLLLLLRVSGKRLMAQLTTFDFILLLLVSNSVQNGLIGNDTSLSGAAIGATVLFVLNAVLAFVFFKSRRAGRIVSGRPATVIENGVRNDAELRRLLMTKSDLWIALQDSGVPRVRDVKSARLEPNGRLLVDLEERADTATHAQLIDAVRAIEAKIDALAARLDPPAPKPQPGQ